MKEFNSAELQQLLFEIEGKVVSNNKTGESVVQMQGILKAKELSQKQKIQLRILSKKVDEILKVVGEQEKALYEQYFDNFGTPEAKFKQVEGKTEEEVNVELRDALIELFESKHPLDKVQGVTVDNIGSVTGTSDFYEILVKLQED